MLSNQKVSLSHLKNNNNNLLARSIYNHGAHHHDYGDSESSLNKNNSNYQQKSDSISSSSSSSASSAAETAAAAAAVEESFMRALQDKGEKKQNHIRENNSAAKNERRRQQRNIENNEQRDDDTLKLEQKTVALNGVVNNNQAGDGKVKPFNLNSNNKSDMSLLNEDDFVSRKDYYQQLATKGNDDRQERLVDSIMHQDTYRDNNNKVDVEQNSKSYQQHQYQKALKLNLETKSGHYDLPNTANNNVLPLIVDKNHNSPAAREYADADDEEEHKHHQQLMFAKKTLERNRNLSQSINSKGVQQSNYYYSPPSAAFNTNQMFNSKQNDLPLDNNNHKNYSLNDNIIRQPIYYQQQQLENDRLLGCKVGNNQLQESEDYHYYQVVAPPSGSCSQQSSSELSNEQHQATSTDFYNNNNHKFVNAQGMTVCGRGTKGAPSNISPCRSIQRIVNSLFSTTNHQHPYQLPPIPTINQNLVTREPLISSTKTLIDLRQQQQQQQQQLNNSNNVANHHQTSAIELSNIVNQDKHHYYYAGQQQHTFRCDDGQQFNGSRASSQYENNNLHSPTALNQFKGGGQLESNSFHTFVEKMNDRHLYQVHSPSLTNTNSMIDSSNNNQFISNGYSTRKQFNNFLIDGARQQQQQQQTYLAATTSSAGSSSTDNNHSSLTKTLAKRNYRLFCSTKFCFAILLLSILACFLLLALISNYNYINIGQQQQQQHKILATGMESEKGKFFMLLYVYQEENDCAKVCAGQLHYYHNEVT